MKIRLILVLIAISGMIAAGVYATGSSAQRRLFSHSTKAHKEGKYQNCGSCHALPTKNWTSARPDRQEPFPDVATYPSHTSCFGCHTKDIYSRGGTFCGTCHVVASMRATGGRGVLGFPARSRPSQFTTLFPHNIHQDLIATRPPYNVNHQTQFVRASFVSSFSIRTLDEKPNFYNCAICHETAGRLPKYEPRRVSDFNSLSDIATDTFETPIVPAFFKDSPQNHASCFNCHYQYKNLPVGKQSCAGCHELSRPYREREVAARYSIKFNHDRVGHVEKDCMSCHLRIAQNNDIRAMKDADVPILACMQCHATQEEQRSKSILNIEVARRDASVEKNEQPIFQCTYCHTSAIGRLETPASHRK